MSDLRDGLITIAVAALSGGGVSAILRALRPRREARDSAEVEALRRELGELRQRIEDLERRPAPHPAPPPRSMPRDVPGLGWTLDTEGPADRTGDHEAPSGILIVEDDRSYARAQVRLLADLKVPIVTAHNVDELRAMLADRVYAVAVIDLGIPGISAEIIVRELLDRRTRVVLCSGRHPDEIEALRAHLGADAAVAKIDGGHALLAAVATLLPKPKKDR